MKSYKKLLKTLLATIAYFVPESDDVSNASCNSEPLTVGGQAVIEGVMIRSPYSVATAVRKSDGGIEIDSFPYTPLAKRKKFYNLPVVRGALTLGEALYLGIRTLNWSAEMAAGEENEESKKKPGKIQEKAMQILSIIAAFALGMGLFMFVPYWISGVVRDAGGSQFAFHAVAGAIRITIFLLYIYFISLWKDMRRVFEYHGAEHKSIFAFEKTGEVEVDTARGQSRFHPRCGTSFLLITAIIVIFLFAVLDTILMPIIGEYKSPLHRLLVHLPFIPLVAGISYEVLKYSSKKSASGFWNMMVKPGLWLQHLTTREPDKYQVEVAAAAVRASLENK